MLTLLSLTTPTASARTVGIFPPQPSQTIVRRTSLDANPFSQNAAGAPRAEHPIDQYGWELDGPVRIPKLYNGKDRTFFMFSQERYREFTPQPAMETVPTVQQRAGDFSQTYKNATQLYTIYDR